MDPDNTSFSSLINIDYIDVFYKLTAVSRLHIKNLIREILLEKKDVGQKIFGTESDLKLNTIWGENGHAFITWFATSPQNREFIQRAAQQSLFKMVQDALTHASKTVNNTFSAKMSNIAYTYTRLGMNIDTDGLKKALRQGDGTKWNKNEQERKEKYTDAKDKQESAYRKYRNDFFSAIQDTQVSAFRYNLAALATNNSIEAPKIYRQMWKDLSSKKSYYDERLYALQLRTLCLMSVGEKTAIRARHLLQLDLGCFSLCDKGGGIIISYKNKKIGKKQQALKHTVVHVAVVPAKSDLKACAIVSLAMYFVLSIVAFPTEQQELTRGFLSCKTYHVSDMSYPFLFDSVRGGAPNLNNRSESASRKIRAVLDAIAHHVQGSSFGVKKCHFFRRFCNSLLMDHGIPSEYRNNMAGWKGDIAEKHYTDKKRQAANNPGPPKLAGKQDADDESHPMFDLLDRVDDTMLSFILGDHSCKDNQIVRYFTKIAILYIASKFAPTPFATLINEHLLKRNSYDAFSTSMILLGEFSTEYINTKLKENKTNTTSDKRRIQKLTEELAEERTKRARLELGQGRQQNDTGTRVEDNLTQAVRNLVNIKKEGQFPELCIQTVQNTIVPSIKNANQVSKKDGFVLRLQDPDGKQLKKILIVAALLHKGLVDTDIIQNNWLNLAETHPRRTEISTKTFSEYIKSFQ